MAGISSYLANKLLEHACGKTSYTMPSTVYLALYTTNPTAADSGSEVSGNGYARQSLTFNSASNGTIDNAQEKTFTASGGSWGTITHWGLKDASTSGNLLFFGALTASKTIGDSDSLTLAVGDLDISLS